MTTIYNPQIIDRILTARLKSTQNELVKVLWMQVQHLDNKNKITYLKL